MGWLIAVAVVAIFSSACNSWIIDIKVTDPVRTVADARRMIDEYRVTPEKYKDIVEEKDLPESLRLPGLRWAEVRQDHINLVLDRNPDYDYGARIWSLDSTRKHADRPTKYPGIFFYGLTHKAPESPDNIR